MRVKLNIPTVPSYEERQFIRIIESYKQVDKDTLSFFIFYKKEDDNLYRKLRAFSEKYNNFLFVDVIPKGKIVCRNGWYILVQHDDKLADKIRTSARLDLITSAIAYKNTLKILGNTQATGQLNVDELIASIE